MVVEVAKLFKDLKLIAIQKKKRQSKEIGKVAPFCITLKEILIISLMVSFRAQQTHFFTAKKKEEKIKASDFDI